MLKHFIVKYSILLFPFCFFSCVSTKSILRKEPEKVLPFTKDNLYGCYSNQSFSPDTVYRKHNHLWTTLYSCKTIKKDATKLLEEYLVKLDYDGIKYLTATLMLYDKPIKEITLKAKPYKDYLSIKKHFFLIPIPAIFYWHNETKVILSNDAEGNLVLKMEQKKFGWIFLLHGHNDLWATLKYKKAKSN